MEIEVLYFGGCPSHEAFLPHLQELLERAGTGHLTQGLAGSRRTGAAFVRGSGAIRSH
jgi:hypothetical protein